MQKHRWSSVPACHRHDGFHLEHEVRLLPE
jgi:hypothetical protein